MGTARIVMNGTEYEVGDEAYKPENKDNAEYQAQRAIGSSMMQAAFKQDSPRSSLAPLPQTPSQFRTELVLQPTGREGPGIMGPPNLYPTDPHEQHRVLMNESDLLLAGNTPVQAYRGAMQQWKQDKAELNANPVVQFLPSRGQTDVTTRDRYEVPTAAQSFVGTETPGGVAMRPQNADEYGAMRNSYYKSFVEQGMSPEQAFSAAGDKMLEKMHPPGMIGTWIDTGPVSARQQTVTSGGVTMPAATPVTPVGGTVTFKGEQPRGVDAYLHRENSSEKMSAQRKANETGVPQTVSRPTGDLARTGQAGISETIYPNKGVVEYTMGQDSKGYPVRQMVPKEIQDRRDAIAVQVGPAYANLNSAKIYLRDLQRQLDTLNSAPATQTQSTGMVGGLLSQGVNAAQKLDADAKRQQLDNAIAKTKERIDALNSEIQQAIKPEDQRFWNDYHAGKYALTPEQAENWGRSTESRNMLEQSRNAAASAERELKAKNDSADFDRMMATKGPGALSQKQRIDAYFKAKADQEAGIKDYSKSRVFQIFANDEKMGGIHAPEAKPEKGAKSIGGKSVTALENIVEKYARGSTTSGMRGALEKTHALNNPFMPVTGVSFKGDTGRLVDEYKKARTEILSYATTDKEKEMAQAVLDRAWANQMRRAGALDKWEKVAPKEYSAVSTAPEAAKPDVPPQQPVAQPDAKPTETPASPMARTEKPAQRPPSQILYDMANAMASGASWEEIEKMITPEFMASVKPGSQEAKDILKIRNHYQNQKVQKQDLVGSNP